MDTPQALLPPGLQRRMSQWPRIPELLLPLHTPSPGAVLQRAEKILWALTFFKNNCAAKWSENVFRQEADTGIFPIPTWGDFEQQFRLHFFPVNAEADAINTLEGTSYHQGDRTVDDYLDNFQTLVSNAGYTDP